MSTTFAALADPRQRALARLAACECSVTELAQPFEMSMPDGLKAPARARGAGISYDRLEHRMIALQRS